MQDHPFFVTTKFAPPRMTASVLVRTRLLTAFERAAEGTLTCVVAGPGLGKTLLLAQWRQRLGPLARVAWLSLGVDEAGVESFGAYLLEALRRASVGIDDFVAETATAPNPHAVADRLVNAIASHTERVWLLIDDFHCVTDPRAHSLLQRVLDGAPGNLRLAIASRTSLPLSLGRLRVAGQATLLDAAALAFDLQETRAFLDGAVAPALPLEDIQGVFELSGGWPASVQLVAIALQRRPETRAHVRQLAGKSTDLHAYLAEEVVRHLPMDLVEFAESVSICKRFDAELAEALTGRPAAGFIDTLLCDGLFIYRLEMPDADPWYRLHPIFAEYLSSRLARRGTAAVRELHRQAGRSLAQRRLVSEALRHARLAADEALAFDAIATSRPTHWNMKDLGSLRPWLSRFALQPPMPHGEFGALASLALAITADPAQARIWLARAGEDAALPHLSIVRAAVALQADRIEEAERLLEGAVEPGPDAPLLRSSHTILRATLDAITGRFAQARALQQAMAARLGGRLPDHDHECVALTCAALLPRLLQGDMASVAERGLPMLADIEAVHGRRSIAANLCAALVADACQELNRLESARLLLAGRMHILRASTPEAAMRAMLCHARLQPGLPLALAAVDDMHRHFETAGLRRGCAAALGAGVQLALCSGDEAAAAAYLRKLEAMRHADSGAGTHAALEVEALAALARLRLCAAAGDASSALAACAVVRRFAWRCGRRHLRAQALAIACGVLQESGRRALALKVLRVLSVQGERFGWERLWLDEHARVRGAVCELLRNAAIETPALAQLSQRLGASGRSPAATAGASSDPTLLTARELQILELLADSMSNKHIAGTLSISQETVKWYLKGIYAKLEVGSRYEALAKARSRGWLRSATKSVEQRSE